VQQQKNQSVSQKVKTQTIRKEVFQKINKWNKATPYQHSHFVTSSRNIIAPFGRLFASENTFPRRRSLLP